MNFLRWVLYKIGLVRLVWLIDHDGTRSLRVVRHPAIRMLWSDDSFKYHGLWAMRIGLSIREVGLNPDGSVTNGSYVVRWEPFL